MQMRSSICDIDIKYKNLNDIIRTYTDTVYMFEICECL